MPLLQLILILMLMTIMPTTGLFLKESGCCRYRCHRVSWCMLHVDVGLGGFFWLLVLLYFAPDKSLPAIFATPEDMKDSALKRYGRPARSKDMARSIDTERSKDMARSKDTERSKDMARSRLQRLHRHRRASKSKSKSKIQNPTMMMISDDDDVRLRPPPPPCRHHPSNDDYSSPFVVFVLATATSSAMMRSKEINAVKEIWVEDSFASQ